MGENIRRNLICINFQLAAYHCCQLDTILQDNKRSSGEQTFCYCYGFSLSHSYSLTRYLPYGDRLDGQTTLTTVRVPGDANVRSSDDPRSSSFSFFARVHPPVRRFIVPSPTPGSHLLYGLVDAWKSRGRWLWRTPHPPTSHTTPHTSL